MFNFYEQISKEKLFQLILLICIINKIFCELANMFIKNVSSLIIIIQITHCITKVYTHTFHETGLQGPDAKFYIQLSRVQSKGNWIPWNTLENYFSFF